MSSSKRIIFPYFLVLLEVCIYLTNDAYLAALPQIMAHYGSSQHLAQMTFASWVIGAIVLQFFIGPISDRFGRRPLILMGGMLFILTCIGCGMADSIHALIIARFLQGMIVPMIVTPSYAAVNEAFDQKAAVKMMATMSSIMLLAPALGPTLGGLLLKVLTWHWIFYIPGIAAVFVVIVVYYLMPETLTESNRIKQLHLWGTLRQYGALFSNRHFVLLLVASSALVGGFVTWIVNGPFVLIDHFGFTPLQYGLVQALIFGAFIAGNQLMKFSVNETNLSKLVWHGFLAVASMSLVFLLGSVLYGHMPWVVIALVVLVCGCAGFVMPGIFRMTIEASTEAMGIRVGMASGGRAVFAFLAAAVTSVLYQGSIWVLALVMLAYFLVALIAKRFA